MIGAVLFWLGIALSAVLLLWVFFLAVMRLQEAQVAGTLKGPALVCGVVVLFIGRAIDFLVNVFVMTVVLGEWPQEATVTARLTRHEAALSGYRRWVSHLICSTLLDWADPRGRHCI